MVGPTAAPRRFLSISPRRSPRSLMARKAMTVLALCALICNARADDIYSIGNSLTWDMYVVGLKNIAASFGVPLTPGYHIRASMALVYIVNNPTDVTTDSPSIWPTALPSQAWRAVTFEPYPDGQTPSTLGTDLSAAQTFITTTQKSGKPQPIFYIYEAWPDQNAFLGNYASFWRQSIVNSTSTRTLLCRQYFDALYQRLLAQFGRSAVIRVIPIGDVLARINDLILAGKFVGATNITDFYRDTYHMGSAGRFLAAITVFATLYGQNPAGAPYSDYLQFNDGKVALTPQMAAQLESIVWDVVSNDARTGVTTSSGDGPLPGWSLGLLAVILMGVGWYRGRGNVPQP